MTLHPKVIDLKLDRVYRLLEALGNPHHRLPPVIHIAGTNGKGSTLAYIRSALEAAGLSCHHYVSPHLVRFHERITLAGELISEEALTEVLERCEAANDGAPITYFEITTCAAFLAFSEVEANYCLLETGLGGRLDATNVIDQPALTIISAISHDHSQFLGDTLVEIAGEKAGILKPAVPAVITHQPPEVMARLSEAPAEPMLRQGHEWSYDGERLTVFDRTYDLNIRPSLLGAHQQQNAELAAASLVTLNDPRISLEAIETGITSAEWLGRLSQVTDGPWLKLLGQEQSLWIDGGHNRAAGEALAAFARERWNDQPLHLIYGMLNTKDADGFLAPLAEIADSVSAVQIPEQINSLSADEAATAHPNAQPQAGLKAAIETAQSKSPSRVLVAGSLYLIGWMLAQTEV